MLSRRLLTPLARRLLRWSDRLQPSSPLSEPSASGNSPPGVPEAATRPRRAPPSGGPPEHWLAHIRQRRPELLPGLLGDTPGAPEGWLESAAAEGGIVVPAAMVSTNFPQSNHGGARPAAAPPHGSELPRFAVRQPPPPAPGPSFAVAMPSTDGASAAASESPVGRPTDGTAAPAQSASTRSSFGDPTATRSLATPPPPEPSWPESPPWEKARQAVRSGSGFAELPERPQVPGTQVLMRPQVPGTGLAAHMEAHQPQVPGTPSGSFPQVPGTTLDGHPQVPGTYSGIASESLLHEVPGTGSTFPPQVPGTSRGRLAWPPGGRAGGVIEGRFPASERRTVEPRHPFAEHWADGRATGPPATRSPATGSPATESSATQCSATPDRWPTLPSPDEAMVTPRRVSANLRPAHRQRMQREQRGEPWNG